MTQPAREKLTVPQAAARLGIRPKTFTSYVSRAKKAAAEGHARPTDAPQPDGRFDGRTPWWWDTTIDGWKRPGQGARSDRAEQREDEMPVVMLVVDEVTTYQADPEFDLVRKVVRDAVAARAEGDDETLFQTAQAASLLTMDLGEADPDEPRSLKE